MQNNLVEQTDLSPIQQNVEPTAQPFQVPTNTPNVQPQPDIQVQPYIAQPVYYVPQYLTANDPSLKERLCCPKVWTWIIFGYYTCFTIFLFIFYIDYLACGIIGAIVFFFVAYNVTKSSNTGVVKKYLTALAIFSIYFYIEIGSYFLVLFLYYVFGCSYGHGNFNQKTTIILLSYTGFIVVIETITLIILCKYKKVFDRLSVIQQVLPP